MFYFIHPKIETPKSLGIGHRGPQSLNTVFWYRYLVFYIIDPNMKRPKNLGIGCKLFFLLKRLRIFSQVDFRNLVSRCEPNKFYEIQIIYIAPLWKVNRPCLLCLLCHGFPASVKVDTGWWVASVEPLELIVKQRLQSFNANVILISVTVLGSSSSIMNQMGRKIRMIFNKLVIVEGISKCNCMNPVVQFHVIKTL